MTEWKEKLERLVRFAKTGNLEIDEKWVGRQKKFLVNPARVAALVFHDFFADGCLIRASALTYTTLLSLVPLLALMFALLKGLGVQNTLEPIILQNLAVGSEDIVSQVITYINNTHVGRLGMVGLLALLVTVTTLMTNIEKSFNHIWGVQETRPLIRRFSDYFSVLTIGPLLVIAAISITSTLQSETFGAKIEALPYVWQTFLFFLKFVPYVGMWIVFTVLYLFMPNGKVSYTAAIIGGVFGGTLWQLAQWAYVEFQIGMARYNAIYGTMAALPILMVWIYISWLIVLLGLEVTYAWQHLRLVPSDVRAEQVSYACRQHIALVILLLVAKRFYQGKPAWTLEDFALELGLPPRLADSVLSRLVHLGLLSKGGDEREPLVYQPGRSPETLKVADILKALEDEGIRYERMPSSSERQLVRDLENQIKTTEIDALQGVTLQDLVNRLADNDGEKTEKEAAAT
ncbi:YhjD/YihY/BrkB family envelope integrity protein [Desulfuromonas sp. AOP6]|uniref:YhjD/YihY/BrkB family envelope integrity protein n=1 Tax=Desulfuromonas sp. AOP6 TaxID=1566351 RepID=UPI00127A2D82|nr:YhjD/YihY/BrkB family envelope integrity protein [Desulfuromonas sp. AOP6]BCA79436.1 hypothetical protein AOP6_1223 [Desulfuromonas sp. AOP6]